MGDCRVSSVRLSLEQSKQGRVQCALPGLEHDRRAADSAAGTGALHWGGSARVSCICSTSKAESAQLALMALSESYCTRNTESTCD